LFRLTQHVLLLVCEHLGGKNKLFPVDFEPVDAKRRQFDRWKAQKELTNCGIEPQTFC